MRVIVGLGNPGEEYKGTRHNVGYEVLNALLKTQNSKLKTQNYSARFKTEYRFLADMIKLDGVLLVKPVTYMNKSGEAVERVLDFYKLAPEKFYVIHDDLDIRLGEYKVDWARGPKVHGGINSVELSLGTKDFWRVRVGVDNRTVEERRVMSGERYVLSRFLHQEQELMDGVVGEVVNQLLSELERNNRR